MYVEFYKKLIKIQAEYRIAELEGMREHRKSVEDRICM